MGVYDRLEQNAIRYNGLQECYVDGSKQPFRMRVRNKRLKARPGHKDDGKDPIKERYEGKSREDNIPSIIKKQQKLEDIELELKYNISYLVATGRLIKSKFNSTCSYCHGVISQGDTICWKKNCSIICEHCYHQFRKEENLWTEVTSDAGHGPEGNMGIGPAYE